MQKKTPKWAFPNYFRANAYAWHGSQKAAKRIKETISEIKKVHKKQPAEACEGIVRFIEKLSPALAHIDSSSGQIGNAVYNAIEILAPIFADTELDLKTRTKWMQRVWDAYNDDEYSYLDNLADHFGTMCQEKSLCDHWADELIDITTSTFKNRGHYFNGTVVCLSCLLQAARYDELLALNNSSFWHYRKFGVYALAASGQVDEAIAYAQQSKGLNDPQQQIDQMCEQVLLTDNRIDEAYAYALTSEAKSTNLATFRSIAKKYTEKIPRDILNDLIQKSAEKGKWFATAKTIGEYELAIELISENPCDPHTINRAARDFKDSKPEFAMQCALHALYWMAEDYAYELSALDVVSAYGYAVEMSEKLQTQAHVRNAIEQLIKQDRTGFVGPILEKQLTSATHLTR